MLNASIKNVLESHIFQLLCCAKYDVITNHCVKNYYDVIAGGINNAEHIARIARRSVYVGLL